MEIKKLKGLYAAVATPMFDNGEINLDCIDKYAEFLIDRKVTGVFVNGSTGEGLLLDNEERKAIAEKWMKFSDRLDILIHVGSTSYKLAGDLAEHADKIGARAISAMGPCFMQPGRVEELVAFNKKIAERAPHTPYYYYHIPVRSGINLSMVDFLNMAKKEIPTLAGIKYTTYDTWQMQDCINLDGGRFDILHGHDESIISGLLLGATGGIGTSYNVTSPIFLKLFEAFARGDIKEALRLQEKGNKAVALMCKHHSSISAIKAMISWFGIPCGPARLPIRNLSDAELAEINAGMAELDL